jgi:hypothetical protein
MKSGDKSENRKTEGLMMVVWTKKGTRWGGEKWEDSGSVLEMELSLLD